MTSRCVVVDYESGNLFSVCRALEVVGASVELSGEPSRVATADRLVFPGVGAFAEAMARLSARGLADAVRQFVITERPFLGICLGMQLMFDWSDEFGRNQGLGLIPGGVIAVPRNGSNGRPHKIPHIGWNALRPPSADISWHDTILEDVKPGESVYFVHSFFPEPREPSDRLADCYYDGARLTAAVTHGSLFGCQFHPEKSGNVGLGILRRFLSL